MPSPKQSLNVLKFPVDDLKKATPRNHLHNRVQMFANELERPNVPLEYLSDMLEKIAEFCECVEAYEEDLDFQNMTNRLCEASYWFKIYLEK